MIDWEDFRATKAAYNIKNILEELSINYITINVYRFSITIKKKRKNKKKIVEGEASSNIILLTKCSTYARECAMSFRFSVSIFSLSFPHHHHHHHHLTAEQSRTTQSKRLFLIMLRTVFLYSLE